MRLLFPFLLAHLLFNGFSRLAHSAAPHETLYFKGYLSSELIDLWSTLPGKKSYVVEPGDGLPNEDELLALSRLRGADRIQLEVERYPDAESVSIWKTLASRGVELVSMPRAGLPQDAELRAINEAGFSRCLLVLGFYPDREDSERLGKLSCKLSITFAVAAYPKYEEKEGLASLPAQTPLAFSTDYWPWYSHMDVFNLLPQPKRLRVAGMMPPDDSMPYVRAIKNLENIQVATEHDPSAAEWAQLADLPVTWSSQGHVPSAAGLEAFARSGGTAARKLIIDSDRPWSAEESARVERSPLQVEWIHAAPDSLGSRLRSSARRESNEPL